MTEPGRSAGRPLRFLAVTVGGWIAARVVLSSSALVPVGLLPTPHSVAAISVERPSSAPATYAIVARPTMPIEAPGAAVDPARPGRATAPRRAAGPLVAIALAAMVRYGEPVAAGPFRPDRGAIPPPLRLTPLARGKTRLAGSAWAIVRGGGNGTLLSSQLGGQLGGSQAGARLTYALGEARRVALSARIASPLRGAGREAAFGLDWQPTRAPLHLLAEQRVSLDGQRGGPTLLVVGGIAPTPLVAGLRLEGYGQAGAIKRAGSEVEAFGDGAARLTRRLVGIGPARIDLGVGAWGAAQRGGQRFDIGPTIGAVTPVARKSLRLALDWRQRIAGNSRPGSGPALSIGTDF